MGQKNHKIAIATPAKPQPVFKAQPVTAPTIVAKCGMDGVARFWANGRLIAVGEAVIAYMDYAQRTAQEEAVAAEKSRLEAEKAERKAAGIAKAKATRAEKKRMAEEAEAARLLKVVEAQKEEERKRLQTESKQRKFWYICSLYPVPAAQHYEQRYQPLPPEVINYEQHDYADHTIVPADDSHLTRKELRKLAALIDNYVMSGNSMAEDSRYCPRVLMALTQRRMSGAINVLHNR